MKKFVTILLFIAITVSLFGCDNKKIDEEYNHVYTDGDYQLMYINQDGETRTNNGMVVLDGDLPISARSEGYFITGYTGSATDLVLPNKASDGKPIIGVGRNAFLKNETLRTAVIPDGYKFICADAFAHCKALESIVIGSDVEYYSTETVLGSSFNVKNIYISSENEHYVSIDNCVIGKANMKLVEAANMTTIPQGIKVIGAQAFSEKNVAETLIIPDSVVEIEMFGFFEAYGLKTVHIGENVNIVGENAFYNKNGMNIYCEHSERPEAWHESWLFVPTQDTPICTVKWGG